MAVEIYFPSLSSNQFVEGPTGYFLFPSMEEDPVGSGLFVIPDYLPSEDGLLFDIPIELIGKGSTAQSNIVMFSVQEDATPIDPSSSFGGVGVITAGLDEFHDSQRLIGEVVLTDGSRGKTSGTVTGVSSTDGNLSVTADSRLGLLNTDRVAQPFVGTLGQAVQYYCDLVGIPNDVLVDANVSSRPVVYPGWVGNVWVHMKQLLAAEQVEMSLVFDRVYVRPLRVLAANQEKLSSSGWSVSNANAAHTVEVYYYNNVAGANMEVYPLTTEEPNIYTVGANETQVFTQKLNATLTHVNQPEIINFVENRSYNNTNGVYAVTGSDDKPITASQWAAQGGFLSVRITDDPSIIEITVRGASMEELAPYRISMSSGSGNHYNALHITGTGVAWDRRSITLRTGVNPDSTSTEIGVTVENPYISTREQAYSLGMHTAKAYAGVDYTLSGTAYDLNRSGQGRNLIQATIEDFNMAYLPGTPVEEFNDEWVGEAVSGFNAYWEEQVDLLWENQLFGNAPGARVLGKDAYFRIISATTTESSVQFTAALDTLMDDFNDTWPDGTLSEFNAQFAGMTMKDFSVIPLRRN